MKYIVIEIQNNEGVVATLVNTYDTRELAESAYHQVLSYAAVSSLTAHSATLLTSEGAPIMYRCYKHTPAPAPEPEPEVTE